MERTKPPEHSKMLQTREVHWMYRDTPTVLSKWEPKATAKEEITELRRGYNSLQRYSTSPQLYTP